MGVGGRTTIEGGSIVEGGPVVEGGSAIPGSTSSSARGRGRGVVGSVSVVWSDSPGDNGGVF